MRPLPDITLQVKVPPSTKKRGAKSVGRVRRSDIHSVLMEAKTKRWTLRVTPAQDMIVRQVVSTSGMSLSEYVVSRAVASAVEDLADRRVFAVSGEAWEELQAMLDRRATAKPKIAELLATNSL